MSLLSNRERVSKAKLCPVNSVNIFRRSFYRN